MCVGPSGARGLKPEKLPKGSIVQNAVTEEPTFAERVVGAACVGGLCASWATFFAVPLFAVFFTATLQPRKAAMCWTWVLSPILLRLLDKLVPALGLRPRESNFGVARICTTIGQCGQRYFGKGSGVVYENEDAMKEASSGSVFVCHSPHGVFALSTVVNTQWRSIQPKSLVMISSTLRYFGGAFVSYLERNTRLIANSREVLEKMVKKGEPIELIPGGFFSATQMKYDEDTEHLGFGIVNRKAYSTQGGGRWGGGRLVGDCPNFGSSVFGYINGEFATVYEEHRTNITSIHFASCFKLYRRLRDWHAFAPTRILQCSFLSISQMFVPLPGVLQNVADL